MKEKLIAAGIAVVLTSLVAVGTFASQDRTNILEEPTATPTETPIDATETPVDDTETPVDATETPVDTTATPTPDATATPGEGTETPTDGSPTPDATETPGSDEDVHGIPDSNPSKHPEDGDGVCEKGETVVKTTPSGNLVNVPCNAAKDVESGGE